jgi:hypothetical protein
MTLIVQKIKKQEESALDIALKYYSIICLVNNIKVTNKQLQLLAFTAIRGTISSLSAKNDFSVKYNSSVNSVNNMISELKEIGLLEKFQGKYRIVHQINLDFINRDISLDISLIKKL